ncbi:MAG: STAS domain-containing protein [Verrucomicrobiota bacterium]
MQFVFHQDVLSSVVEEMSFLIKKNLEDKKQEDWNILEIDLHAVRVMDSMGLNLLIGLLKHAQLRNARVRCKISSPTIHRTFLFTRLDKQMDVEFDRETSDIA